MALEDRIQIQWLSASPCVEEMGSVAAFALRRVERGEQPLREIAPGEVATGRRSSAASSAGCAAKRSEAELDAQPAATESASGP
jgi:hypothetical protein